ncbi:hypothetical protein CCAX7_35310 [Capsulimonas corticalis]|uniref:Uncharacterized protein n=1 Tax=Capsulimonas corticalis TaxID=2219043 RepID=A0A402CY38_9BACT|nr:restriction endonuclease [Capsulimonas corticalis]BDI31480.1 hypothetical protein CCAX7_35310 [Capsulimonas corticalis]
MTTSTLASSDAGGSDEPKILRRLREKLLALSYPEFQRCLQHLLEAMGYADVAATGRIRRRGRNLDGGVDLVAWLQAGVTRFRIVAQAKQLTEPVQKRSVDELRGAALRLDARQGLIMTTAGVSPVARAAAASVPTTPIRLIDGTELAELMVRYSVGVIRDEHGIALDEDYWRRLSPFPQPPASDRSLGKAAQPAPDTWEGGTSLDEPDAAPALRVHITVALVKTDDHKRRKER